MVVGAGREKGEGKIYFLGRGQELKGCKAETQIQNDQTPRPPLLRLQISPTPVWTLHRDAEQHQLKLLTQ